MKIIAACFLLVLLISSCKNNENPADINSPGQVKLADIGIAKDGWGIQDLVVSHDGSKIYYAVGNYQTFRYELRMMDAHSNVTKIFSGDGEIDALDIAQDDNTLLYSVSINYGTDSKLYEYALGPQIQNLLLSVTGDGYFWNVHYLPDGNIIYTQGDGRVNVSLRRFDRVSKEATILLDKDQNPLLIDVDEAGRLLVEGWTSNRIITLKFDGTGLKDFGQQTSQIAPVCFSPDGSEILAYQQGNPQGPQGSAESYMQAISYDVQTGEKSVLTHALESNRPFAYGKDKNELVLQIGNQSPTQLSLFDRSSNTYDQLTNNQLSKYFLDFYGNSKHRLLFEGTDEAGNSGLYILNKM